MTDQVETNDVTRADLDLGEPRILPLTINGKLVTWNFGPIGAKEWRKYFQGIRSQTEQRGDTRYHSFDADGALIALVRNTVKSVEGYGLMPEKAWRTALPFTHCLAVGRVLRSVVPSEPNPDAVPTPSDLVEISLDAPWTAGDKGQVTVFNGLIHRFREPTIEQVVKFNMEISRTTITGNSEYQVTTYPSRHLIAMKLYDELIREVDGYAYKGVSLGDVKPEEIAERMDGMHKAIAVIELFANDRQRIALGAPEPAAAVEDE